MLIFTLSNKSFGIFSENIKGIGMLKLIFEYWLNRKFNSGEK